MRVRLGPWFDPDLVREALVLERSGGCAFAGGPWVRRVSGARDSVILPIGAQS